MADEHGAWEGRVRAEERSDERELAGNVEWIESDGTVAGSVPFTLSGSLLPGASQAYSAADGSLRNGTLQTNAPRARITFTNVTIVE